MDYIARAVYSEMFGAEPSAADSSTLRIEDTTNSLDKFIEKADLQNAAKSLNPAPMAESERSEILGYSLAENDVSAVEAMRNWDANEGFKARERERFLRVVKDERGNEIRTIKSLGASYGRVMKSAPDGPVKTLLQKFAEAALR